MILYLDSSALFKLFVVEPGSDLVARAVAAVGAVATHLIAYTEIRATFTKMVRRRSPDGAQRNPGSASLGKEALVAYRGYLDSAALHPGYGGWWL